MKSLARGKEVALVTLALAGCAGVDLPAKPIAVIEAIEEPEVSIGAVRSDGFLVFVGDELVAVTAKSTTPLRVVPEGLRMRWRSHALSADGRVPAATDVSHAIWVLDRNGEIDLVQAGELEVPFLVEDRSLPDPVALDSDGQHLAYGHDHEVRVVSVPDLAVVTSFANEGTCTFLRFFGEKLVVWASDEHTFERLPLQGADIETKAALTGATIPAAAIATSWESLWPWQGTDSATATTRDGRTFALDEDGTIRVFDGAARWELAHFPALSEHGSLACLSGDETLLLAGGSHGLGLFDARTRRLARVLVPPSARIVALEHRGAVIVARHGFTATAVYDRSTGACLRVETHEPLPEDRAEARARSQDGALDVRAIGLNTSGVFDTHTAELLWRGDSDWWTGCWTGPFAFSPDAGILAVMYRPGGPRLLDARTGELLGTLEDVGRNVTAFAFSPDDRELGCGYSDGSLRIFAVPEH